MLTETEHAWEKQKRDASLGTWTYWCRGECEKADELASKEASTSLL